MSRSEWKEQRRAERIKPQPPCTCVGSPCSLPIIRCREHVTTTPERFARCAFIVATGSADAA